MRWGGNEPDRQQLQYRWLHSGGTKLGGKCFSLSVFELCIGLIMILMMDGFEMRDDCRNNPV
jgi:hypothetical protein